MPKKILVVSFSKMVAALARGEIEISDLPIMMFFFSYPKIYILDESSAEYDLLGANRASVFAALAAELSRAEGEGRVFYPPGVRMTMMKDFNDFVANAGMQPVGSDSVIYLRQGAVPLFKKANPDVTVIA